MMTITLTLLISLVVIIQNYKRKGLSYEMGERSLAFNDKRYIYGINILILIMIFFIIYILISTKFEYLYLGIVGIGLLINWRLNNTNFTYSKKVKKISKIFYEIKRESPSLKEDVIIIQAIEKYIKGLGLDNDAIESYMKFVSQEETEDIHGRIHRTFICENPGYWKIRKNTIVVSNSVKKYFNS